MAYVVNNHLNNLNVLFNKAVETGKKSKSINVGPTSIPESRVIVIGAKSFAGLCNGNRLLKVERKK